ncbi:MAG: hypothetical protein AB2417_02725 [Clostridiaceae bacterium]
MADYYITPEEYKIAKNNGISKKNLEQRVREYGWSNEKAISTPVTKRGNIPKEFKELAKSNEIDLTLFYNRVCNLKWDMYRAATMPVMTKKRNTIKEV